MLLCPLGSTSKSTIMPKSLSWDMVSCSFHTQVGYGKNDWRRSVVFDSAKVSGVCFNHVGLRYDSSVSELQRHFLVDRLRWFYPYISLKAAWLMLDCLNHVVSLASVKHPWMIYITGSNMYEIRTRKYSYNQTKPECKVFRSLCPMLWLHKSYIHTT